MSFRNVSIRLKIAAAFGVVLLLVAAIGAIAVNSLASVNATTTEFHDDWMPSVRFVDDIRYNMARHRAILGRHVMSTDAAQMAQVEGRLANAIATLNTARSKFEALTHTQKERDAYASFVSGLNSYLKVSEEMMVLSRRHEHLEAGKLYMVTVSKVGLEAESVLDQLTGLIREGADEARNKGRVRYEASLLLLIGSIALAVLVATLSGYLLSNAVSRPVLGMTQAMARLAEQDMNVTIPALGQTDEIGQMARAMEVFKDNMIEAGRLRAEQADSEIQNRMQQKQTMQRLANDFEAVVGVVVVAVSSAAGELEIAARTLTQTADTTRDQVEGVASNSDEASKNVQAVASATEEMASSVSEIGRQVEASAKMANDAVIQARRTDEHISKLTRASEQIGGMVNLISSIAGQTNLLALNATIEAARAGEAGRGFAVVASEVKALAMQTAEATSVISAQIAEIQSSTQASATAIREIGSTISDISGIASAIAAAVEEQGAATNEIARNVQHAAKGTSHVADSLEQVTKGASETGSASAQVLSSAQSLSSESERLNVEVTKFLASVRAA